MLLSPDDAQLFFNLHPKLMHFVNERLNIVPGIASKDDFCSLPLEMIAEVRDAFLDKVDLVESFVDEHRSDLSDDEIDIVLSWRHAVSGKFYVFRQLKKHAILLSADGPPAAYGVVALTQPLRDVVGQTLPAMTKAVLLPFRDKIIYDSLITSFNITFGGGIKRRLNDSYREAKEQQGIVTSLPAGSTPQKTQAKKKRKPAGGAGLGSKDVATVLRDITDLIDAFCREHLNDEYSELCRRLAEKLSRKRPSPLLRGKPITWACGIVRTIGWVNFLDDPTTQPHLKLRTIDQAFGIAESTGQAKSRAIRDMLKIGRLEVEWSLPSRMDDNPRAWLLEVNGLAMDVRNAPKEIQIMAYEKGMIPYIPDDQKAAPVKVDDDPIYQFKITLKGFKPAVWRRIQIQHCTLNELHEHIQTAMGWTNSHLHHFKIGRDYYSGPAEFLDDCIDSTKTNIRDIVTDTKVRTRFSYEYDFGDSWEHEVLFERCLPYEPEKTYPLCISGSLACPPEDIGGVWGYTEYLEAISDPNHEQHDEMIELHGPFDPDEFDTDKTTEKMRQGLYV